MPFIQFIPGGSNQEIQATLTARGLLALSAAAINAFGLESATHVLLFFDPDRRALGLRAAKPEESGAQKLTRRKRVTSLSIRALLEQYRLVVPGKLIMEPQFDEKENLIVIPLLGVRMKPGRRPIATRPKVVRRRPGKAAAPPSRRGRPRKAGAEAPKPAAARRGRPPKRAAVAESTAPKRRGRPPKQEAREAPAPAPKRRGRPPKAAASAETTAAPTPKRRGRPRKSESPA